jgi:signal transduction histidine kinase
MELGKPRAILDGLHEGIVAFDSQAVVFFANRSAVRMMNWENRCVVGESAEDLFRVRSKLLALLKDGFNGKFQDHPTEPLDANLWDDTQRLAVSTAPLDLGIETGLVVSMQDVSTLRRAEWEMFQLEKMSALGRLAASVAHEVRNPLGAIGIQLQLLEEDLSDLEPSFRESISRRLNIAQLEMKRLDRIVQNFLRFSSTPKLNLKSVCLNDVVRHVFELVMPEAREQGIFLSVSLGENLPPVSGDESQLGQAVLNIIVNAFQAIEGEGVVEARTRPTEDGVCLTLSDTGCGIPQSEIDRIFEVYYTTRDEGTGLGLSIAQRIIYQHGGHIDLSSEQATGTRFDIFLPAIDSEPDSSLLRAVSRAGDDGQS